MLDNCFRFAPRDSIPGLIAKICKYLKDHPGWSEEELEGQIKKFISATGVESFNGRTGTVTLDKNDVNSLKIGSAYFAEGDESINNLDLVSLYNQGVRFVFTDFNSVTSGYNLSFVLEYFSDSGNVVYYPMSTGSSGGGNIISVNGKTGVVELSLADIIGTSGVQVKLCTETEFTSTNAARWNEYYNEGYRIVGVVNPSATAIERIYLLKQDVNNHTPIGLSAGASDAYTPSNPPPYPVSSVNNKTGSVGLKVVDVSKGNSTDENAYIFIDETENYPDIIATDSNKLGGQISSYYATAESVNLLKGKIDALTKITPQMFGAKGDGSSDDSKALRDWLAYVIENEKTGFIPDGVYRVAAGGFSYRNAGTNFAIIGESTENTILAFDFTSETAQPNHIDIRNCSRFTIKNFTIKCSGGNPQKTGVALYLVDCNHANIENIEITNCSRGGVLAYSASYLDGGVCDSLYFENVNIYGVPNEATHGGTSSKLYPMGWILSDVVNTEVRRSNIYDMSWYGFEFKNYCKNSFFIDCNARRCVTACHFGAEMRQGDTIAAVGSGYRNINCYDVDTPIVAGAISDCIFDGINCYYSGDFTFKATKQYSARIQEAWNCFIRMSIFNMPYGGVYFSGDCDNNIVVLDYVSKSSTFTGRTIYAIGENINHNMFIVKAHPANLSIEQVISKVGNNVIKDEVTGIEVYNTNTIRAKKLYGADTPNNGTVNESGKALSKTFFSENGETILTFGNLSKNYIQARFDIPNNQIELHFKNNGETHVGIVKADGFTQLS